MLLYHAYVFYDVMFYDVMFSTEGKSIPTELQEEAVELRKTMRFDDSERQGENYYLLPCSSVCTTIPFYVQWFPN